MRMDGSGHDWIDALGDWFAGAWDDVATFFNENIIEPVVGLCSGLAEDIRNADTNNQSEQKVIDSNYFSFYKGKLVIRADISRSGTFGVIFLGRNVTKYDSPEDVVRHEYGHALQFEELGVLDFALCVGIPSWRKWGSDAYYDKPWEADADIRGGVISRKHTPEVIEKAQSYIQFSKKYGIIAWLTIE